MSMLASRFGQLNLIRLSVQVSRTSCIHTSEARQSRRNIRKFPVPNDIGQYDFKHTPLTLLNNEWDYPMFMDEFRQRYPGYLLTTVQSGYGDRIDRNLRKRHFVYIREMEPELIVPDLTDFGLKPYVSYRTADIQQTEFTARALFNIVYGRKILERLEAGEEMTIEYDADEAHQAKIKALQTGADLFVEGSWYDGLGRDIMSDDQLQKKYDEKIAIFRKYGKTVDSRKVDPRWADNKDNASQWPPIKITKR